MLTAWDQKDYDWKLVEVAVGATLLFVSLTVPVRQRVIFINLLFIFILLSSLLLYSFLVETKLSYLPVLFYRRIFDGTNQRYWLLLFWSTCTCATLFFCYMVNRSKHCSTKHRKFFHFSVSLVCITGLKYDFEFTWLCAWLMLCFFVFIETFRSKNVPPWSRYLNDWLLIFLDKQDSSKLILTPIYLLTGIFLPLFLSPITNNENRHLYHFAGVATVGVGDSLAAIIGSQYGRLQWPASSKTVEGSVAYLIGQCSVMYLICIFYIKCDIGRYGLYRILASSFLCAILEAQLPIMDNLIIPLVAYLTLYN